MKSDWKLVYENELRMYKNIYYNFNQKQIQKKWTIQKI